MAEESKEELNVRHNDEEHQGPESGDAGSQAQEAQGEAEGASDQKEEQEQNSSGGSSFFRAPQNFGNSAGDTIQNTLGKVGNPVGAGLEKAAAPIGSLVEPVVGGLHRMPEAVAQSGEARLKVDKENKEAGDPLGGKEQTASNPLGLNQK